jgi:hypothetical protein
MALAYEAPLGLTKSAVIEGYDPVSKQATIVFDTSYNPLNQNKSKQKATIELPVGYCGADGLFVGARPVPGTRVSVTQGDGGKYFFSNYLPFGGQFRLFPELEDGELLVSSTRLAYLKLTTNNEITLGANNKRIKIGTSTKSLSNYKSELFDASYEFSQSRRSIADVVRREIGRSETIDADRLFDDSSIIGMEIVNLDPASSTNMGFSKVRNPPFVETRELVYEFAYDAHVDRDNVEIDNYGATQKTASTAGLPEYLDRRNTRANTLALSLFDPNALIETTKGTVVDIFGNILDLNRQSILVGSGKNTLQSDAQKDRRQAFKNIKAQERKSIAYHFEINARKDLDKVADLLSDQDYARGRSRFFMDIDKEGQFKANVPASSEAGNVPILSRYENYSLFKDGDVKKLDQDTPNKLLFRDDNVDIIHDSFASKLARHKSSSAVDKGVIDVVQDGKSILPLDRITEQHIKHGTAYHDITDTCYLHQTNMFFDYQIVESIVFSSEAKDQSSLGGHNPLKSVVSDKIEVGKNAGGRSGQVNFDGSVEFNIGANTVDRQSMWLDTSGGVVANIGRDLRDVSAALAFDGDVIVQVGGYGISNDSRFSKLNNGFRGGKIDIRVFSSGYLAHMFAIDDDGITIMTPSNIRLQSSQDISIASSGSVSIECEDLIIQGRRVMKGEGGSI